MALKRLEARAGTNPTAYIENALVQAITGLLAGDEATLIGGIATCLDVAGGITPLKVKGTDIVSLPGIVAYAQDSYVIPSKVKGTDIVSYIKQPGGPGPDIPTSAQRRVSILSAMRTVGADPDKINAEQALQLMEKSGALPEKVKGTDIVSVLKEVGLDPKKVKGTDIVGFLDGMGSL